MSGAGARVAGAGLRRGLAAFVAVAALLLLAAGCGSGSGGGGTTGPSGSSSTTTPSREVGGEKSIEEFGSEASGSERAAIVAAFHGYLEALAAKDFGAACKHLSASTQRSLEQFVVKRLKAKGCVAILPKLLSPTAPAVAAQQAKGRITKVRVEGNQCFVVFHAPGAKLYEMTMVLEGGAWKPTTVAASILVPQLPG